MGGRNHQQLNKKLMIQLQVIGKTENQIRQVKDLILKSKYTKSIEIDWNRTSYKSEGSQEIVHKLSCITKAAFFTEIQKLIHLQFEEKSIEIYAIPLSYFDWSLNEDLKQEF
jgi:hypothetical protein